MNNYCYDIHHTLAIDYLNGYIKIGACCQSGRIDTTDTDVQVLWDHPKLKQLRQDNINGKLDSDFCRMCVKVEQQGQRSRRIDTADFYQDWDSTNKKIRSLDIKLGTLCNLKCTICSPNASSSWVPDARLMGIPLTDINYYNKSEDKNIELSALDNTVLADLEMIKFWGGEPLIDEKHADILEFLDQQGILKNCRVLYNTNATHRVSDRVLKLWSRAKLVELYFSIDDVGERFNYQRFGADWSQVCDTLTWYKDTLPGNHLFYITCTVSYLNAWYLNELVDWKVKNFDTNRLGDATKLCYQPAAGVCAIEFVTPEIKQQLMNRFQDYPELVEFLKFPHTKDQYKPTEFIDYVTKLDGIRNTSWSTTFKEFEEKLRVSI